MRAARVAGAIVGTVGADVAASYVVFALFALFFDFMVIDIAPLKITIPVVINGLEGALPSGGGFGLLVVLFAVCTIAGPYYLKNRYKWLALCVPFAVTLYADWGAYQIYRLYWTRLGGVPGLSGAQISLGLAAYVTFVVAAYAAWRGVKRYKAEALTTP